MGGRTILPESIQFFRYWGVILLNQCSILHEMGGKEEKYKDRIVLTEQVADLCTELADLYDL